MVGYAAGQTDKFQGTGVWSGVKMERETEDAKPEPVPETREAASTVQK
jgi:hypothetical protein